MNDIADIFQCALEDVKVNKTVQMCIRCRFVIVTGFNDVLSPRHSSNLLPPRGRETDCHTTPFRSRQTKNNTIQIIKYTSH